MQVEDLYEEQTQVMPAQGILWKISGGNLEVPSYLYASLFVVPKSLFFLHPAMDSLLDQCQEVMMEVDPDKVDPDYLFRSEIPIDSSLEVLMGKKQYKALWKFMENELTEASIRKVIGRYPPLIVQRQIMFDFCLRLRQDQEAIHIEKYLKDALRDVDFSSLNLEWVRSAWLDQYSWKEQTRMLQEGLDKRLESRAAFEGMIRAYRQQNLDRVWFLSQKAPDLGDNKHVLIDLRVSSWKEALTEKMPQKAVFGIIPAVTLPGEYGLLHQLRKQGYRVEAIAY